MSEETPKKSSALMGLIKGVIIVAVLVVVEVVAAAMIIPSAEQTEKLAHELARATAGDEVLAAEDPEAAAIAPDENSLEVELLTDNITRFNPETNATLNVQFAVYAVLLELEEPEFTAQYAANKSRIHEQIMLTMHGAKTSDLSTAGLGLIKRQILEKTNRTLGRPLIREVVFTKLNFIER